MKIAVQTFLADNGEYFEPSIITVTVIGDDIDPTTVERKFELADRMEIWEDDKCMAIYHWNRGGYDGWKLW